MPDSGKYLAKGEAMLSAVQVGWMQCLVLCVHSIELSQYAMIASGPRFITLQKELTYARRIDSKGHL